MEGFTLREFFVQFLGHELLEKVLGGGKKEGEKTGEKSGDGLKANIGGLGVNDEVLFWDACAMAMTDKEFGVSKDDFNKIVKVFSGLQPRQRAEVINIIGRDEQEIKLEEKSKNDKGKDVIKTRTEKKNKRGANFILLLSKMTEDEIKEFLLASGAKETTMDDIEGILEELEKTIGKRWATVKRVWGKLKDSEAVTLVGNHAQAAHCDLKAFIGRRRDTMAAVKKNPVRFW